MEQEKLFDLLAKSLSYAGIVYKQSTYQLNEAANHNVFTFEFKHSEIPEDSVLFFLPSVSSDDGDCVLRVRIPSVTQSGVVYSDYDMPISVETMDGVVRKAGLGDIIANRLCIFRFNMQNRRAILVNSPLYGDAAFSTLRATNAEFTNAPRVAREDTLTGYTEVVTQDQLALLAERVSALEQKIVFGTEDPDEALADKPAGTIYIQVAGD